MTSKLELTRRKVTERLDILQTDDDLRLQAYKTQLLFYTAFAIADALVYIGDSINASRALDGPFPATSIRDNR